MRTSWLRIGLTSLVVASGALSAALVACSDDDENKGTAQTKDSGAADSAQPTTDSGTDAAPPPPKKQAAKLQVVNAATDLGPSNASGFLRFCYELAPNVFAPLPPLPDTKANPNFPFPGVPVGTGGAVDGTGADLSALAITPVLLNAQSLAARGIVRPAAGGAGPSCGDILGADKDAGGQGPLVANVDYWTLAPIPAGTLLADKSFVLVLTGCVANTEIEDTTKCGPDFVAGAAGVGNLKSTVYELDRATAVDGAKIGTQFIHASPAGAAALVGLGLGEATPGYTAADNSGFKGVSADAGPVALHSLSPLKQVDGVDVQTSKFTVVPTVPDFGINLQQVQALTFGGAPPDGGAYRNGAAFTFIALGDPAENADAGGNFNTKKFHYIALPNDPVTGTYK